MALMGRVLEFSSSTRLHTPLLHKKDSVFVCVISSFCTLSDDVNVHVVNQKILPKTNGSKIGGNELTMTEEMRHREFYAHKIFANYMIFMQPSKWNACKNARQLLTNAYLAYLKYHFKWNKTRKHHIQFRLYNLIRNVRF